MSDMNGINWVFRWSPAVTMHLRPGGGDGWLISVMMRQLSPIRAQEETRHCTEQSRNRAVNKFSRSEWSHHAYLCMQCESAGRQFQQAEGAPPNIVKTFATALAQTHTRMSPFPIYLHMLTYFIHTLCHPHRRVQQADPKLVYLEMRKSLSINHKVRW